MAKVIEHVYESIVKSPRHEIKVKKDAGSLLLSDDLTDEELGKLVRQYLKVQFLLTSIDEDPQFVGTPKYVWIALLPTLRNIVTSSHSKMQTGTHQAKSEDLVTVDEQVGDHLGEYQGEQAGEYPPSNHLGDHLGKHNIIPHHDTSDHDKTNQNTTRTGDRKPKRF